MPVRLNSTGGGSVTLDVPATSGTFTINLPAASGSIVAADGSGNTTFDGNIAITGTARRITGDFSNATVANRVYFQTSTTNGITTFGVIPNGSGAASALSAWSSSDPTNASVASLRVGSDVSDVRLQSGATGTGTFLPMTFFTGGSERMRIGANGRVGFGTSSTDYPVDIQADSGAFGWNIRGRAADGISVGRFANNSNTETVRLIAYNDSTFAISNTSSTTERMRIDASGNVGIGTASPGNRLQVSSPLTGTTPRSNTVLRVQSEATGRDVNIQLSDNITNAAEVGMVSGNLYFATAGSERARITSGGDFLVGTSSTFDNVSFNKAQVSGGLSTFINTTGATTQISFFNPNGRVGWIGTSGTSTSYNTSSDYRLKENVVPLVGASARVQALKPSRFNFIADPDRTVDGFIAHEAAEVVPEAVIGEKDALNEDGSIKPQGIDQSKLVPLLTAALQEALSRIETLEARLAAVEAR